MIETTISAAAPDEKFDDEGSVSQVATPVLDAVLPTSEGLPAEKMVADVMTGPSPSEEEMAASAETERAATAVLEEKDTNLSVNANNTRKNRLGEIAVDLSYVVPFQPIDKSADGKHWVWVRQFLDDGIPMIETSPNALEGFLKRQAHARHDGGWRVKIMCQLSGIRTCRQTAARVTFRDGCIARIVIPGQVPTDGAGR